MQFNTGISALQAHQIALSVAGHNIANASTPGYHRQEVLFKEKPSIDIGGHLIGTGVSVDRIRRAQHAAAEEALAGAAADGAAASARLATARQIEALFLPGSRNVFERTESFFNDLQWLSAYPDDSALRANVLRGAAGLADELNRVASRLDVALEYTAQEIAGTVEAIEGKSQEIATLNQQIAVAQARGDTPNNLLDQRGRLVQELAELVDVEAQTLPNGRDVLLVGGLSLLDTKPIELDVVKNDSGQLEVWKAGCDRPLPIQGGKLGGLLSANNDTGGLTGIRERLDEFTKGFITEIDAAHAFGVGLHGAFQSLRSLRSVTDTSAPIASADPALPVEAGSLFVSLTETGSRDRTLTRIDIDPGTDSLEDIAAAISNIDHMDAKVDTVGGNLVLVSDPGYAFDFTGNPQTWPDPVAITGTTQPKISGAYTGAENDEFTFTFLGSGTVGVDPGLRLEVTDSSGAVVKVLQVGSDYEPGSELLVTDGLQLSLSSGSANVGDSFLTQPITRPDETGFLTAMGLNTFFTGAGAADIRVNPLLTDDPTQLATTTTGDPHDTSNLLRMIQVRDDRSWADGTRTFEEFLAGLVASVGHEVQELTLASENTEELRQVLQAEVAGASGVDVNEELAKMLEFQRGFQAAARYITVIDEMLQEVIGIIR